MKRFYIKLWNGRGIILDWNFKIPLEITLGYHGVRAVQEMNKLKDNLLHDDSMENKN